VKERIHLVSIEQIRTYGYENFNQLYEKFRDENANNLLTNSSLFEETIWKWTDWKEVSFLQYFATVVQNYNSSYFYVFYIMY